eukprot:scaffold11710_cov127-Isochrysis_galbana.AAC.3
MSAATPNTPVPIRSRCRWDCVAREIPRPTALAAPKTAADVPSAGAATTPGAAAPDTAARAAVDARQAVPAGLASGGVAYAALGARRLDPTFGVGRAFARSSRAIGSLLPPPRAASAVPAAATKPPTLSTDPITLPTD